LRRGERARLKPCSIWDPQFTGRVIEIEVKQGDNVKSAEKENP